MHPIPSEVTRAARRVRITPRVAVAVAYVASLLMAALDANVVNVMLPTLTSEFQTTLAATQWAVLAYVLALAIAMPSSAWLSLRFGDRRVFLWSLGAFTASSAACGLVMGLPELVAMRAVQGASGGLVMPVATAMLFRTYPPAERAKLVRTMLLPIAVGPALAPPLGGLLVEQLSWRWAFFINIPVGLAAMAFIAKGLHGHERGRPGPFDLLGFLLVAVGLAASLIVLGEGFTLGLASPVTLISIALAGVCLTWFVLRTLRQSAPLLELRLLSGRLFRQTNIATALQCVAFLGGLLYVMPIFLQTSASTSPLEAGLVMALVPVGVITASQTVGRRYHLAGPRRMITAGHVLLAAVLGTHAFLGGTTPLWVFCGLMLLAGLTNGTSMVALQASMFARIGGEQTGSAATIYNVNRQLATAVGIAVATVLVTTPSSGWGFRAAFLAAAAFSLGAAVAGARINDAEAAATMSPPVPAGP